MATLKRKHKENTPGNFYVDDSCIDCDTCRWMAPSVFNDQGNKSVVFHQPETKEEEIKALQALIACPTSSIGTEKVSPYFKEAIDSFPILIEDNIFDAGYHAESSFGATSYFIKRSEGNILVDSPRFASQLVKKLEGMGGAKYMFLTHQDDVADHEKYHEHFGCERIIHSWDQGARTKEVEIVVEDDAPYELEKDLVIIPIPGHTKGSCAMLYKNKYLFTGDHLAWSDNRECLIAFRNACWYSWEEQIKSMEKLMDYDFEWVLPGHGRMKKLPANKAKTELSKCIEWMKSA